MYIINSQHQLINRIPVAAEKDRRNLEKKSEFQKEPPMKQSARAVTKGRRRTRAGNASRKRQLEGLWIDVVVDADPIFYQCNC